MSKDYLLEESQGLYYVYEDIDGDRSCVYIASSKDELKKFNEDLVPLCECLQESHRVKPIKSKKAWDPDKKLEETCNLYRKWAGWEPDEVITEDYFKNEDWRLRKMSALKNTPVQRIKEGLLNQRIQTK